MSDGDDLAATHPARRLEEARKQVKLALEDSGDDPRQSRVPIVRDDDRSELVVETRPDRGSLVIRDGRGDGAPRQVELELDEAVLVAKTIDVAAFERL